MTDENKPSALPGLPEGWTTEALAGGAHTLLKSPNEVGYATVDWSRRGFRSGCSVTGPMASTKSYAGRGWREQLVRDAVAWLGVAWSVRRPVARKGASR